MVVLPYCENETELSTIGHLELSLGEDPAERAFVFPKKAVNIVDERAEKLAAWKWKKG